MVKEISPYAQELVVTCFIRKNDRFLITRRSPTKARYAGRWTVPGGKVDPREDYLPFPRDTPHGWRGVLERAIMREILEEVGLKVRNLRLFDHLGVQHEGDGQFSLIHSYLAEWRSGKVKLLASEADAHEWIKVEERGKYDLIGGIPDDLVNAERAFRQQRLS